LVRQQVTDKGEVQEFFSIRPKVTDWFEHRRFGLVVCLFLFFFFLLLHKKKIYRSN
jgi:hypothetical protein